MDLSGSCQLSEGDEISRKRYFEKVDRGQRASFRGRMIILRASRNCAIQDKAVDKRDGLADKVPQPDNPKERNRP